jgi:hypothetical protein
MIPYNPIGRFGAFDRLLLSALRHGFKVVHKMIG